MTIHRFCLPIALSQLMVTAAIAQDCRLTRVNFDQSPDGRVNAMTVWDPDGAGPEPELLVAGGEFTTSGGVVLNRIGAWDGVSWHALGTGVSGTVWCLGVYRGDLIIGGIFRSAGGTDVFGIARWDGLSWHSMGSPLGINGSASELAVLGDELIVAGRDGPGVSVARWDGSNWNAMGETFEGFIGSKVLSTFDGAAYFAREAARNSPVLRWDTDHWTPIGDFGDYPWMSVMRADELSLLVGGFFNSVNGDTRYRSIARWDGTTWAPMGVALGGSAVTGLARLAGRLYAGTHVPATLAEWAGTDWIRLEQTRHADASPSCLTAFGPELFWGGRFGSPESGTYGIERWRLVPAADLNHDGVVDVADLVALLSNFGDTGDSTGDVDDDGDVDLADLAQLLAAMGESCF